MMFSWWRMSLFHNRRDKKSSILRGDQVSFKAEGRESILQRARACAKKGRESIRKDDSRGDSESRIRGNAEGNREREEDEKGL